MCNCKVKQGLVTNHVYSMNCSLLIYTDSTVYNMDSMDGFDAGVLYSCLELVVFMTLQCISVFLKKTGSKNLKIFFLFYDLEVVLFILVIEGTFIGSPLVRKVEAVVLIR